MEKRMVGNRTGENLLSSYKKPLCHIFTIKL
jgi:hypothetical protein